MVSRNEIRIIGNIGSDPVVRESNGTKSVQFSVATSENWIAKEGEQKSITQWHKVVLHGHLCEFADILKASMHVCIFGKIRTYQWQDNGVDKMSVKVIAQSVFVGAHELRKGKPGYRPHNESDRPSRDHNHKNFENHEGDTQFDDIPF